MKSYGIPLIALTGKMRSGKSTIARELEFKYDFERVSFADGINLLADTYFEHMYEPIKRPCPFGGEYVESYRKPRRLLQDIGQKMREIDPQVWIRRAEAMARFEADRRSTAGIVIDDLRQPNEYKWARANGFIIIRVEASETMRLERAKQAGDSFSEDDLAHDTEQYVDKFDVDYTIVNDGDINDLERQVDEIMSEIKAKGGR